jgi:adenylosuccinate lyase
MFSILAVCPLDGRYQSKSMELSESFSEFALIKFRVLVEIHWLIALCDEPGIPEAKALSPANKEMMMNIYEHFTPDEAQKIKDIEKTTNHDVKAVEYYLKDKFSGTALESISELIHFACTSEDINNLAHALMLKSGIAVIEKYQSQIQDILTSLAVELKSVSMLSRTHGQTASPTTLGKELAVFVDRLKRQSQKLKQCELLGKINGAVGNFNAHYVAYPKVNWVELSKKVIEENLGLQQNLFTTQIEPHDYMAEIFDVIARWNTILIDLDRDIWTYISMGYFKQRTVKGEIGSSTMPHKVNPIDFENSEGNLGLANAILGHFSAKLPISRLQRDLTDSTVLRNMGVAFGYSLVAYQSTIKGLGKLIVNEKRLKDDLNMAWEILAEPIQTVMRKASIEKPYEKLKELTRGNEINQEVIANFIETLALSEADKTKLKNLSPSNYIGIAEQIVGFLKETK